MRTRIAAVAFLAVAVAVAGCGKAGSAGKWKDETGDIPFVVGAAAGARAVAASHRPPMYFFTATW